MALSDDRGVAVSDDGGVAVGDVVGVAVGVAVGVGERVGVGLGVNGDESGVSPYQPTTSKSHESDPRRYKPSPFRPPPL